MAKIIYHTHDNKTHTCVFFLEKGGCLLVDEEGRLKRKIVNQQATAIYNKLFDGFIVGDVIHIKPSARKEW